MRRERGTCTDKHYSPSRSTLFTKIPQITEEDHGTIRCTGIATPAEISRRPGPHRTYRDSLRICPALHRSLPPGPAGHGQLLRGLRGSHEPHPDPLLCLLFPGDALLGAALGQVRPPPGPYHRPCHLHCGKRGLRRCVGHLAPDLLPRPPGHRRQCSLGSCDLRW